jgi:hydroxymethylbilane synthase
MKLKCATRGRELALAQAREAISLIDEEAELVIVKSVGDLHGSLPFESFGERGIFTNEVNKAVLDGRAHIGIHSLKDLPTEIPPGLALFVPKRGSPNDLFISRKGLKMEEFNGIVGTSSPRRRAQLLRRGIRVKGVRGDLTTRLKKLKGGEVDALVVAAAAIKRLDLQVEGEMLDTINFTPSPGQGALAIVAREGSDSEELIREIEDEKTRREVEWERGLLRAIGGGCSLPFGAVMESGLLRASLLTPDGAKASFIEERVGEPMQEMLRALADELRGRKKGNDGHW